MLKKYPELVKILMPIPVLYSGKLKDLYPEIPTDNLDKWHEEVLAAMKADKEHLGMELDEPLCKNKVPREGICVRIEHDVRPRNFKLKCVKFLAKESKNIDSGQVDSEMLENNY